MAPTVNMHQAKSSLSKLVADLESGAEKEIVISRNGKPVAKLVPMEQPAKKRRLLGIAEGKFGKLDEDWFREWQALDEVIWKGVLDEPIDPDERIPAEQAKKKSA